MNQNLSSLTVSALLAAGLLALPACEKEPAPRSTTPTIDREAVDEAADDAADAVEDAADDAADAVEDAAENPPTTDQPAP